MPQIKVLRSLQPLIPKFLGYQNENLQKLKMALDSGNYVQAQTIGHIIKGASGGYGFDELSRIGKKIESAAKAQEASLLADCIREFQFHLENISIDFV